MEMLSKAECPEGNIEFLSMIADKYFDRMAAERLLLEIPDIDQLVLDLNGYSTTYLFEAQTFNNVEAVRFLLEHGADPNLCHDSDCALYDLHIKWIETPEEVPKRLEIAKLFFEFGGDPNIRVDGETLYDHVVWEVFYDDVPMTESICTASSSFCLPMAEEAVKVTARNHNLPKRSIETELPSIR